MSKQAGFIGVGPPNIERELAETSKIFVLCLALDLQVKIHSFFFSFILYPIF